MTNEQVETLFTVIRETIQREDLAFFLAMQAGANLDRPRGLYAGRYPPGLNSSFFEQGIVFLLFRALVTSWRPCPFELAWECEYPDDTRRMDLGLFERDPDGAPRLVGALEAKWWSQDGPILADVAKLRTLADEVKKFLLLMGTWTQPENGAIERELHRLGLNGRSYIHLFQIHGAPMPDNYHWSHFYVILSEVQAAPHA